MDKIHKYDHIRQLLLIYYPFIILLLIPNLMVTPSFMIDLNSNHICKEIFKHEDKCMIKHMINIFSYSYLQH